MTPASGSGTGPLGNGTYALTAIAYDAQFSTTLGTSNISVNNAGSVLPF